MMQPKPIYYEDLHVLQKLWQLPKETYIYDPQHRMRGQAQEGFILIETLDQFAQKTGLGINLSDVSIAEHRFDFLLYFNALMQAKATSFYYFNNPNGTIRWIFPSQAPRPSFLNLYNGSGWKARLFKLACKWSFGLGKSHWMASGQFSLQCHELDYVKKRLSPEHPHFSIFMGTVGKNRKAIVELNDGSQSSHFAKVAISEASRNLIKKEQKHLAFLNTFVFQKLELPLAMSTKIGLQLSNIAPKKIIPQKGLSHLHLQALQELYQTNMQYCSIRRIRPQGCDFSSLQALSTLETSQNSLPLSKIKTLSKGLLDLSATVNDNDLIAVAYAHGDFTPWNMYCSTEQVHLYDWELADPILPIWYDAFHYIFQTNILIHRKPFAEIQEQIQHLAQQLQAFGFYKEHFQQHYQLYLLFNCSYYLRLYVEQQSLHEQAHWLVDCWTEALEQSLSIQPQVVS